MNPRADDTDPRIGWDETLLVWNATVARIPAPIVALDSAEDAATRIHVGELHPGADDRVARKRVGENRS